MRSEKNLAGRRAEIRSFLMARRAALAPEAMGLPGGSRRRTPGLRREELAALAGIGVTWYTWFEQGRQIQVSARTLERIAAALRLTPSDTEYLFSLCGIPRQEVAGGTAETLDNYIEDALAAVHGAPAFIINQLGVILSYNPLADLLFEFEACEGPFARNHHWRFFMDPKRRARYVDWEVLARIYVPVLRLMHGKLAEDAYYSKLIQELLEGSEDFRRLWNEHHTSAVADTVRVGMKLRRFGAVYFNSVRFLAPNSRQALVVLPAADDRSARVIRKLTADLRGAPIRARPRKHK
jgi:transcriptional regulator with XRE-family HTH domain